MQQDMDTLRSTIDGIDRTEFDRVVGKLVRAKRIYILGVRSSSFLGGYLNFYFHLIFDNVTLVGVLAADQSLYVDNYRAAERTFVLLTQVVGRAGRGVPGHGAPDDRGACRLGPAGIVELHSLHGA